MLRLDTEKLAHLVFLPFLLLRCLLIDLFLHLKLEPPDRGVPYGK